MKIRFLTIFIIYFTLLLDTSQAQYSFFVAGHVYGKPGVNNEGVHPPFKDKFDYIQSRTEIVFGVFTGDIVSPNPEAHDWDEIDTDIEELGLPVYFAVGNHDMENRPLFESRYGNTYYHFTYNNDLFIVLDPNIDNWNISGEQLNFLENTITDYYQTTDNIFCFFHQLLFRENDNIYKNIIPNSFAGRDDEINFWTEIEPLFQPIPNNVVMFCGDLGAGSWSTDFMYDHYDNITFIGSGMGEGADLGDNFVVVNVDFDKSVSYNLICLNETLNCHGNLTDYQISPTEPTNISPIIYPNPFNKIVNIKQPKSNIDKIIIYDINGRIIINRINIKQIQQLDLTSLEHGIYIFIVQTKEKIYKYKIIKE